MLMIRIEKITNNYSSGKTFADPNWNVVATTNASGTVQERMRYDTFGRITWLNASFAAKADTDFAWNRTFTGQVFDSESDLMLYRNRYYHSGLGRFISRDPIGYDAGDVSLYRYVGNRPKTQTDIYGKFCENSFAAGFGLSPVPSERQAHAVMQNLPPQFCPPPNPDTCFDLQKCLDDAQKAKDNALWAGRALCAITAIEGMAKTALGKVTNAVARKLGKEEIEKYLDWLGYASLYNICMVPIELAAELDYQLTIKACYEKDNSM